MHNPHNPYPLDTYCRVSYSNESIHGYIKSVDGNTLNFVRYDSIANDEGPVTGVQINKHAIVSIEFPES